MPLLESAEVIWCEEVDSTSRLAREYLNHGHADVRVFAARRQTAGVGRQGREWQSVDGNLHLSIALPGDSVPASLRDILPLAVGVAVVRWLERGAGIRAVLKWPNDIVLDGAKVGGILCEATITGGSWTGAVAGIGMNLVIAPDLKSDPSAEYLAGSILDSTGIRLVARLACDALSRHVVQTITDTGVIRDLILSDYRLSATAPGQLWRSNRDSRWWSQAEFDATGNLILIDPTSDQSKAITSADHEFTWTGTCTDQIFVADIGNTRIKMGVWEKGRRSFKIVNQMPWTPSVDNPSILRDFVHQALAKFARIPPMIHVASVNAQHLDALRLALHPMSIEVREIRRTKIRNTSSKYDLMAIGLDRLVGIEAALALRAWGQVSGPLLVVSAGTATTIDFIDGAGIHHGGLIGVGVGLGKSALHYGTAALPQVDEHGLKSEEINWATIAHKTTSAIQLASVRMQASWIEREIVEWAAHLGVELHDCQIVLAGGHAGDLMSHLSPKCRDLIFECPELVLFGVGLLATAAG